MCFQTCGQPADMRSHVGPYASWALRGWAGFFESANKHQMFPWIIYTQTARHVHLPAGRTQQDPQGSDCPQHPRKGCCDDKSKRAQQQIQSCAGPTMIGELKGTCGTRGQLQFCLICDRLLETDRTSLGLWIPFPCTLTGLSGGWRLCKMTNGARDIAGQIPGLKSCPPTHPRQVPSCSCWRVKTLTSLSAHGCQDNPILTECLMGVKASFLFPFFFFSVVKICPSGFWGTSPHWSISLPDFKGKSHPQSILQTEQDSWPQPRQNYQWFQPSQSLWLSCLLGTQTPNLVPFPQGKVKWSSSG